MRDAAFERLYHEYATPLFKFFLYRIGDRTVAEDLVSDTFERVLRARWRFDPRRGSEAAWLYSVALNRLRDYVRRAEGEGRALEKAARQGEEPEGGRSEAGESALRAVEARQTVFGALASLSDEEREAVALRYGADLTLAETARVIGERRTTVEGRIYRALRKMRAELD
ncbi:MAG TPA: sigma-70 family RNA polymerase sigma factor [Thermoleophilaceae bacterium]|nr:sigma-70 family RNA polymerase sigma factor [Thermoleophilaceae bacterium]